MKNPENDKTYYQQMNLIIKLFSQTFEKSNWKITRIQFIMYTIVQ